jgi:hypothetical protein
MTQWYVLTPETKDRKVVTYTMASDKDRVHSNACAPRGMVSHDVTPRETHDLKTSSGFVIL